MELKFWDIDLIDSDTVMERWSGGVIEVEIRNYLLLTAKC